MTNADFFTLYTLYSVLLTEHFCFTAKSAGLRGDVDSDGNVGVADVTALIDYLLTGNTTGVDLQAANVDGDSSVSVADVTALIDYILTGNW